MPEVITDAKGRKLSLRKLNVLDQVRLLRAIGADQANNQPYAQIVNMAVMVEAIDGVPCPMPTNERQIDGVIGRIGDEGFAALMVEMRRQVDELTAAAEAAASGEGEEAKATDPLPPSA